MDPCFWSQESIRLHLHSAAGEQVCRLDQPFALLGGHPDCDVVLEGQGIEQRSLLIVLAAEQIFGAVLHPAAKKAGRVFTISEQRVLKLGPYALDVAREGAKERCPLVDAEDSLSVVTWKTRGVRYHAVLPNQRPVLIGRRQPAALVVEDESLSALHACLFRDGSALWVLDLGSANGTLVDRELVRAAPLPVGGSFRAGSSRFHFLQLPTAAALQSLTSRFELATESFPAERRNWQQHRKELLQALASLSEQQQTQQAQRDQEAEMLVARIRELEAHLDRAEEAWEAFTLRQAAMQWLCQQHAEQLAAAEESRAAAEVRHAQLQEELAERARILSEAEREATQRELRLLAQGNELRKQRAAFERDRQAAQQMIAACENTPSPVARERAQGDDTCISSPHFTQILTAAIASHRTGKSV